MGLVSELRRRNVLRMAVLYLGAAWLVMQVVDLLIDRGPLPEALGPAMLVVLSIGFPISLLLAWFYEVTPEGILPDEAAEAQRGAAPATGRALDFVIIAVLSAAVLMFAYDKWWTEPPPQRSVAVLPFINMSTDEEAGHLGTGIADTILNMLAQMPELHVASATSSFQSRLEGLSVPEIADLLGVTTLLEGSVQRQGNRLRITAQLIDAESNAHLWSSNFTREDTDIFKVQDEIAAKVSEALHIVMREEVRQRIDRAGTDNLAAFEAYSRAVDGLRVRTTDSVLHAVEQLQRAVELDPDFARAHAMLGYAYLNPYYRDWSGLSDAERRDLARDAAKSALRIAPGLSTALAVLGGVTDDGDAKRELLLEAMANDPNDTMALQLYAGSLFFHGKTDEAMAVQEKLIRLDPLDEENYALLARMQRFRLLYSESLATLARGKEKIPDSVRLRDVEYWAHGALNDYSSQIRVKHETLALDPKEYQNRWAIAEVYLTVGMPDEAARWYERAIETAPETEREVLRLNMRIALGVYYQRNDEEVFESLQRLTKLWRASFSFVRVSTWHMFVEYGDRLDRLDEVVSTFEDVNPQLIAGLPDLEKRLRDTGSDLTNGAFWQVTFAEHYASVVGEALVRAGDRQRGEPLLRRVLEWHDIHLGSKWHDIDPTNSSFIYGHRPLHALLALGETEAALDAYRARPQKLFFTILGMRFVVQNSPVWAPIRATPEYTAYLAEFDRHAAEHRRKLQEMDLPIK